MNTTSVMLAFELHILWSIGDKKFDIQYVNVDKNYRHVVIFPLLSHEAEFFSNTTN